MRAGCQPDDRNISTDIVNPIFAEVLRGIEDEIGSSGTATIVQSVAEHLPPEKHPLRLLELHQVDGVIAFTSHIPEPDLIAIHERFKLPLVVINLRVNHPRIPSIVVDFENAAYRSAQHLLKLNHTRIAYLAGLPTSQTSRQRRTGIERALGEVDVSLPSSRVVDCFPSIEGGFQAMSTLLQLAADDRPTGVIAYNDLLALGALHAIRVHGLNVPEQISVVGFDNIALAAHANPPLTTIDQPKYRMGRLAMQLLNNLIGGNAVMGRGYTLLECPLIIRESTAPYTGADRRA